MTRITAAKAVQAGAIIRRSVRRGAISPERADFYAAKALRGEDISYLDDLTAVLSPVHDEDEFAHLWPPKPGKEHEWEASRLAASVPPQDEDDLTEEEYRSLYPPGYLP